jgi:hypothetical protein
MTSTENLKAVEELLTTDYTPSPRPMISFMISVVPPKKSETVKGCW